MALKRRGLIGTIVFHLLILALLILGGLTFADPPPEEEGILVNFGTDDTGFGNIEPAGNNADQGNPEPEVTEVIEETIPESAPPEPTVSEVTPVDNTQDVEEVVVKEDPKPTPEEIRRQQEEAERIRKEQEAERQRLAEEERIRKEEEAERQRLAEEQERLAEEQRKRDEQANRLNRLGRNTFGNTGAGEQSGSEGINPGSGTNQGVETGTPGATNYGDGRGLGDGRSYGLGDRNALGLPLPDLDGCDVTQRVEVVIDITVDRNGNVTRLEQGSGTTTSDQCIIAAVKEAARRAKFSSDQNASISQKGWIKYIITP